MSYYAYMAGSCAHCGADMGLIEQEGGRPREYCSAACRQAAYRNRRDEAKRNSVALQNQRLLKTWNEAGFTLRQLNLLVNILNDYGPDAAKAAAALSLDVARDVRQHEAAKRGGDYS